MAQNIMKISVNDTGNIVGTTNMTCVQNSSDNVLRLYFTAKWDFVTATFTQPDGSSEKHFMTIQYDLDDNLYAEYTLPSKLVSFLINGNYGYLTASFQGSYYDSDGYLHESNVINSQITVKYSNNAAVLDASYNQTDIENIWYSIGVINQELGIGSGDSYLNKVSTTQKINGIPYGSGNINLYASDIYMSENSRDTVLQYFDNTVSTLSTDLSTLSGRLQNGSFIANRAQNDSNGNNIVNTYVPYTYLNGYATVQMLNNTLEQKLDVDEAFESFYTKAEVDNKITNVYRVKGSVPSKDNLPVAGNTVGDTYNAIDSGVNYVWTGTEWDALGGLGDLAIYASKQYVEEQMNLLTTRHNSDVQDLATLVNGKYNKSETYTKIEVGNLLSSSLSNYYTQGEVNTFINTLTGTIADKVNKSDTYTKLQIDNSLDTINNTLSGKANSADVYTKSAMDTMITNINSAVDGKADKNTTYTKAEIDALIPDDVSLDNYYTKDEADSNLDTAIRSLNLSSYAPIAYVDTKVANLVGTVPSTLDTLKELADALGNDANFSTTIANQIGQKANSSDVYTKTETDALIAETNNDITTKLLDYYNKDETISQINDSLANYYSKSVMDVKLQNTYNNAETYINNKVAALVGTAPETLDTLGELSAAIAGNEGAINAINRAITSKADKVDSYTRSELYTKEEVDLLIANVPQCKFVFRNYIEEE